MAIVSSNVAHSYNKGKNICTCRHRHLHTVKCFVCYTAPPRILSTGGIQEFLGALASTLTCTSTGSPATTVSWLRDGLPLTIDGSTFQMTQTVINRRAATYENVLIINDVQANIVDHTYTCTVANVLGSDTQFLNILGTVIPW